MGEHKAILGQVKVACLRLAKVPGAVVDLNDKLFVLRHCYSRERVRRLIGYLLACHEKLNVQNAFFNEVDPLPCTFKTKATWVDYYIVLARLY
jgi:hypothetical protein